MHLSGSVECGPTSNLLYYNTCQYMAVYLIFSFPSSDDAALPF